MIKYIAPSLSCDQLCPINTSISNISADISSFVQYLTVGTDGKHGKACNKGWVHVCIVDHWAIRTPQKITGVTPEFASFSRNLNF